MFREGFWPPQYEIRLRIYASLAALAALLAIGVTLVAFIVAFSWPQGEVGSPTAHVYAGTVGDFEVAQPVQFPEGKFWLVKKEDGSFIALSWSDPRNSCSIPWREGFMFEGTKGWFREPCHGSTYNVYGERVFGPSPWNMNQYPVDVVGDKVYVRATEQDLFGEAPSDWRWPPVPGPGEGNSTR
jgi:nitrite reductase/ring-hydroxylating ferredoxin subunit